MYIARILYPVEVLGPGRRVGLWLSGCAKRCKGCGNPELWTQRPEQAISVERIATLLRRLVAERPVDGVTITGGEPMDQAEELALLLPMLAAWTTDILVYSGYTLEALRARNDPSTDAVLRQIAALIDGDYREELNEGAPLRGSSNQCVHIFDERLRSSYERCLSAENTVQNFSQRGSIISAGIHRADYSNRLKDAVLRKGLVTYE